MKLEEFLEKAEISRSRFDTLRNEGKINPVKRSRRWWVPKSDLERYFNEEIFE